MFLQSLRGRLTLVLLALLPFHAFLVTVFTKLIVGPGHAPLSSIAVWKEGILAVILGIATIEWLRKKKFSILNSQFSIDLFDWIILVLLILSVAVTALTHSNWSLYLFGFRYDFIPLVAFLFLRRVPWSTAFLPRALKTIVGSGVIVALYGIVSLFLPDAFFTWLGYSDLHSLYVPSGPIAAFQQIGGSSLHRIQSVMSGPNHLGIWLLLPLSIVLSKLSAGGYQLSVRKSYGLLLILFGTALLFTFSRAAWIGSFVMLLIAGMPLLRTLPRKVIIGGGVSLLALGIIAVIAFPSVLLRISSTRGHIEGPLQAIQEMIEHPLGKGMGMAGPASNRVSDACVKLGENDDASWAEAHPNLCVFLGDTQVQPVGRACMCPFLPENWYLQIGVEMGVVGLVLYLSLMGLVVSRLWKATRTTEQKLRDNSHSKLLFSSLLFSVVGVSTAALFLHAWEDSAVAYSVWMLLSASLLVAHERDSK